MRQKFFRKIAFRGVALRSLAASSAAFRGVVSRAAAVLLLGMTAANAMGAADMARPAGLFPERASADFAPQPGSPAGCHSHENPAYPAVPVTPRGYECCVTGHRAAIRLASFSLRPVLACVGEAGRARQIPLATTVHFSSLALITPFGSPPGGFSLRI